MRALVIALIVAGCSKAEPEAKVEVAPTAHEDRHEPAIAAPKLRLDITVDGATTSWREDAFAKVPHVVGKNNGGESRDVWSLRELAHALVGPKARVVAVHGNDAKKAIDPAAWNDPARTPIVHTTRRGTLKYRWMDRDGKWGDTELKDVVKLEISNASP